MGVPLQVVVPHHEDVATLWCAAEQALLLRVLVESLTARGDNQRPLVLERVMPAPRNPAGAPRVALLRARFLLVLLDRLPGVGAYLTDVEL